MVFGKLFSFPLGSFYSSGTRFLYFLILCMDANFRLKNQLVLNYSTDPGLGIGWAYFVLHVPYEVYVLSWVDEDEVCHPLVAL